MPQTKAKKDRTVLWWILWITATIVSFFIAHAVWTPWIAEHFGSVREPRNAIIWVIAVFGTWMVILFPLIIVMYQKVDKAYEDARIRREEKTNQFRFITVDRSRRVLGENLRQKLRGRPETIQGGHLVSVTLKNGSNYPYVFIAGGEEILGIYDETDLPFEASEIHTLEVVNMENPPFFTSNKWLRVDGTGYGS